MELMPFNGRVKRNYWSSSRRRRGYNRLSPNQRNVKVVRFGTTNSKRLWRLRLPVRVRLRLASPLKLWHKLKNAYMNMMLKITTGSGGNAFGTKRIPKARDVSTGYSRTEFENRLIFEIYKSMVASYELGYTK